MDQFFRANAVLAVFSKRYMELKKNLPIRPSEMGVLNIITQTPGPHTPLMLSELTGVSKPMITAHITSLLGKGYITKEKSVEDMRVYYIHPTQKALELVASAKKDMDRILAHMIEAMGQEAFDQFVSLAEKVNIVMKKELEYGSER